MYNLHKNKCYKTTYGGNIVLIPSGLYFTKHIYVYTGACRGFPNRCGAKNSAREAREKFLSATPIFLALRLF